jgi:prolyl-tRNA synthetase
MEAVDTPTQKTIEEVSALLGVAAERCIKTLVVRGSGGLVALCLRGDHELNEVKAARLEELAGEATFADETEVERATGCKPGFIGPVGLPDSIPVIVDRDAAVLADFVCGANSEGRHLRGVNWERDARITRIADLRKVVEGDPAPDGKGTLSIVRGIEVGHVFQLGDKYADALGASVLDDQGKARTLTMGCYGIGVSRIVAAAIEQNHDEAGIVWPEAMAPWRVIICPINMAASAAVREEAERLYEELGARGIEVALDDRGLRPGPMFADAELIGIPHRIVIGDRGLAAGTYEYRRRGEAENRALSRDEVLALFS